jgi:CheY-like chemotaxis protein
MLMSSKKTILLIEDDKDISDIYLQWFEMQGEFSVLIAPNGEAGLASIARHKPDVVLLDMMMPTMSGLEALNRIRALPEGKDIKVIALTNMSDPDTVKALDDLGVIKHIVKADTTPSVIVDIVREVISK